MKKYAISDATTLKQAVELMKTPEEAQKAKSVATVWSVMERKGKPHNLTVYIEMGRKARLIRKAEDNLIVLGDMHLTRTREFVKGLKETHENS